MKFVDEVEIEVRGGEGGRPCRAFLREKFRPLGGPAGGDGGRGGDVVFETDSGLGTLLDLRYQRKIEAPRGEHGRGKHQHGKGGDDVLIRLPVGTLVFDADTGERIADLNSVGDRLVIAKGGRGGLGNARFATSTDQAPRRTIPEMPGEHRRLRLELRLLADVGLVGRPNAGKSTLIRAVSAARPKVADYPFTTLVPNLGVVNVDDERNFVLADVPGLIPGAHEGQGLGDRFLRHLGRTALLVHLVDLSGLEGRAPLDDFDEIRRELEAADEDLDQRRTLVVGSKMDLQESRENWPAFEAEMRSRGFDVFALSAATSEGTRDLVAVIADELDALAAAKEEA